MRPVQLASVACLSLSGCCIAEDMILPVPHASAPFALQTKNATAEITFAPLSTRPFTFYLEIQLPGLVSGSDRSISLLGDGSSRTNHGIPLPVRLTVERLTEGDAKLIHDVVVTSMPTDGGGQKIIGSLSLPPGRYRARVQSLADEPALAGAQVQFDVHVDGRNCLG